MGHLFSRLVRYNLRPLTHISFLPGGGMLRSAEFAIATPNHDLPVASAFPRQPATWYLLGRSGQIGRNPLAAAVAGHAVVAFRDSSGAVAVIDARCSHMGADLGRGSTVGGVLQCPYHHWCYDRSGRCVSIPGMKLAPSAIRVRAYPAVERHGYVFAFNGPDSYFPLPFFENCNPDELVAGPPFQFKTDSPWYMLVGNGFDVQHFNAVHDRKMIGVARVDCPSPWVRRMQFDAEVVGKTLFDRLLRRFVGPNVKIKITSWGGPFVLVDGIFRRAHSRLLVASQPMDDDNTISQVIVFTRRAPPSRGGRLADWVSLRIRRRFTQAFAQDDIERLRGIRYQPQGLTALDQDLIEYFRWLTTLPRSEYEELAR